MKVINVVGQPCPIPVIEAKKALRETPPGDNIHVLVDNEMARQNLEKMALGMGCSFEYGPGEGENILITITTPDEPLPESPQEDFVVAIGSGSMGSGDDTLGVTLMKAFVHSLTELDTPPQSVLLFNGGVWLSTTGAATVEDLQRLQNKGTVVSSCGACLDFYKIKDNLAVGNVTNMYAIASAMAAARRLINLN